MDEDFLSGVSTKKKRIREKSPDSDDGLSISKIKEKMVNAVEARFGSSSNHQDGEKSGSEYEKSSDDDTGNLAILKMLHLIRGAKHKVPFVVQNIANGLINAKKLIDHLLLIKRQRSINKEKVEFRNIKWFRYEKFGFYKYRYSFDETEEWKEVDIRGRSFSPEINIDISSEDLAVLPNRQVDAAKVADIQKQLPYIPIVHHQFYKGVRSVGPTANDDSSLDSGED